MPKITTFLSYDTHAEEAVNLYVSTLPNSRILQVTRYGDAGPMPKGTVMTIAFELLGRPHVAMNGGPHFKFANGVSLAVECETQEEIDAYWEKLSAGGKKIACGWLEDRFGLAWQVFPRVLIEMISDQDRARSQRVMQAMMQMQKIEIAPLKRAYDAA